MCKDDPKNVTSTDAGSTSISLKKRPVSPCGGSVSSCQPAAALTIPSPSEELEQALMALQWAANQTIGRASSDTVGLDALASTGDSDAPATPAALSIKSSMPLESSRAHKRKISEAGESTPTYHRAKAHKGRGCEQDYICSYCKKVKTSTSAGSDGRVRIRCECGGQRMDGKSRLHAAWVAVDAHLKPIPSAPRPAAVKKSKPALVNTGAFVFVDETMQHRQMNSPPVVAWELVPQDTATGYPVMCI